MPPWLQIVCWIFGYFLIGIIAVIVYHFFDTESKDLGSPGDAILGVCVWPLVGLLFVVCGAVYTVGTMIERLTGKKF
jgi:Na+/proline symporter